jgi:SpoVK/Ycf46/Vps4 family AAA+-type ATPase
MLLRIPPAGTTERTQVWLQEAAAASLQLKRTQAELLAATYRLDGARIKDAVARAVVLGGGVEHAPEHLVDAARALSTVTLGTLGREVIPRFGWDDIVLPAEVTTVLHEIVDRVRHRPLVFGDWGFNAKHAASRNLSVLFSGPSGTGKTMSAEVMANDLGLSLYRVDLAAVVSKYIGETEKNLSKIFDDASSSGAILFFDEADAMFGKRSEISDSHDRYANLEVSYLLQRMEEYDGIVILASNLRNNMDDAFIRRLHFAIDFPFPEIAARAEIFHRTMPRSTPLADDVDLQALARRYRLSGGNIRNVVVAAAFLAAAEDSVVSQRHLELAVRREHQKMGKWLVSEEALV